MTRSIHCQSSLLSTHEHLEDKEEPRRFSSVNVPSVVTSNGKETPLKNSGNYFPFGSPPDSHGTPSRASSSKTLSIIPFGFEAKTSFNASGDLTRSRSERFTIRPPLIDDDIWKRPPPDFRPQAYVPNPPKRNSREAVQPWKYTALCDQEPVVKKEKRVFLPHILKLGPECEKAVPFETRFHIMDPDEARADFVKNGMYAAGVYTSPNPHDHRGLQSIQMLGLPEFTTASDHDPFNLKFHSQHLRTIHGLNTAPPIDRGKGRQMAPPLHLPPKWESRLILSKDPWPQRKCAYTRYRSRSRTAHSALMERVSEKLSAKWAKEKLDAALKCQCES